MSTTTTNPADDKPAPAPSSAPAQTLSPPPPPPPPPPPQQQQQQNIPTNSTSLSASTTTPSSTPSYQSFHTYPFATDAEFKVGLGVILGKPAGTPVTEDEVNGSDGDEYGKMGGELLLKAKMFYFAKKFPSAAPLTSQGYKTYLQHLKNNNTPSSSSSAITATTTSATAKTTSPQEPAYPTPFAHIIDLITHNQPIPGIQDIPDTVLTGKDKPSVAARRRKPWEVTDGTRGNDTGNEGGGDDAIVSEGGNPGGESSQQQQQQQQLQ